MARTGRLCPKGKGYLFSGFRYIKGQAFHHRSPKVEIWASANIGIRNIRICMGKKTYRFRNLRKWKDFDKKQLTLHKMCVTSLLCGLWANLWPFYGLYCKRISLYITGLHLYFELGLPVISLVDWSVWKGEGWKSVIVVCESDRCILMALKKTGNLLGFQIASNLRREEQTTVGQPALRSGRTEDTQGTEKDQR